ncbi:MFS transporter [bacterium]|nr:MFS transporter [bacterium]
MKLELLATFRSLRAFNYRLWAAGAFVSNVGTWMQRIAQDWLVLTELTHKNATAVGIVMALQFGPQMLLMPLTGWAADNFDRRKLLIMTQGTMGLLALGLGILTAKGTVQLWQVDLFALGLGCVAAFDAPARQAFVSELVDESDLSNAVALNSSSFNLARMVGPAAAGVLIPVLGSGGLFLLNAASFAAVIAALCGLRREEMRASQRGPRGSLWEGFSYVWHRRDLRTMLLMLFLIGTFGLNFPIFISTMSVNVFHLGSNHFGFLTSMIAVGSVAGALLSASRDRPRPDLLWAGASVFGLGCLMAAVMPGYVAFALSLMLIGISAQTFTTTVNGAVQLATDPHMRGRVMAILIAVAWGGTPIGAPLVGWVADHWGARWSLVVAASAAFLAAALGYLDKQFLRRSAIGQKVEKDSSKAA